MIVEFTDRERKSLEKRLGEKLLTFCAESKIIGYNPRDFLRMLAQHGPVNACVRVIMPEELPPGFGRLAILQRLDLTVEAAVVNGPWKILFEKSVIDRANKRLIQFERPDLVSP